MDYSNYEHLLIEIDSGVALLTLNRPEVYNATNFKLHNELSRIWVDIGRDPEVRVAVVTGAGNAFSAGGDFEMIEKALGNMEVVASNMQEASDIVHNMINLDKPVVSAINGVAVGAGPLYALQEAGDSPARSRSPLRLFHSPRAALAVVDQNDSWFAHHLSGVRVLRDA